MEFNQIKELIDDAMTKRDRSVSIYISPDSGMSVNVYPWPDADACSEMLKRGEITMEDFRVKLGLPRIKRETLLKMLAADHIFQGGTAICSHFAYAPPADPADWGDEK